MKEYKVGDTIYVKGKVKQLDKDGNIYCYQVYIADVGPLWVYNSDMVEKLPTAEPVKLVLPKKVADELEIAKKCKDSFDVYIMRIINGHPTYENSHVFWSNSGDGVIKTLMDAWNNGYTVEKPKRYVLPMPGTDYHNYQMHGNAQYYAVKRAGSWRPDTIALGTDDAVKREYTVTQSDIDTAPAWVKAIKPFEVTDDEQ